MVQRPTQKKRTRKATEHGDLASAFRAMSEQISLQAREPNILAYQPHAKQEAFHRSEDYIRLYIGGNRSGKTFGTVAEDIWWASGTHPYQRTPPTPIRGRVVAVDLLQGVNSIILPLFARLMAPSMLINGSWEDSYSSDRILTFSNGSFIEFMSYEMKLEKFAGTSRHFIHYDEEPPKPIYDECQARLVDTEGHAWLSMTPVEGITWVHADLYKPTNTAVDKQLIIPGDDYRGSVYRSPATETTVVEVSMGENPHLSEKARERFFRGMDEETRAAREKGAFVQVGGKIFKSFTKEDHVIPQVLNPAVAFRGWELYMSIDHGWANPTAVLWHAVSPTGEVVTFGEHYKSEMTIKEHADIIKAKEAAWGIAVPNRTGDPAMKQTTAVTGTSIAFEYSEQGIYLALEGVPRDVETGLARMQQYFRVPKGGKPKWRITEDCVNFINEMENLHAKLWVSKKARFENNKQEGVHKKDDHAFDSARYFCTWLPDLAPLADEQAPDPLNGRSPVERYDEALVRLSQNMQDRTEWTVVETF